MTQIEERLEAADHVEPDYATTITQEQRAKKRHRSFVGGKWELIGQHQFDYLVEQGLTPETRFLDVGCGSFRGGVHYIDHLNPGNYYGLDVNRDVIEAGYDEELSDEQRKRLPVQNLRATDRFDADFGVAFDMAIAQSVLTHISLNRVRLCMYRVAKVMKPGGRFFVTFNEQPPDYPVDGVPKGRYTERDIYWYYRDDIRWAAGFSPWDFRYIGDWGHPRGQRIVELTRRSD